MWIKLATGNGAISTDHITEFTIQPNGDVFTLIAVVGYNEDNAVCRIIHAASEFVAENALLEDILLAIDAGKNLYYIGNDDGGEEDAPMDSEE